MRISPRFFYAFFVLYLVLALFNLDKLPVAWVDETMLIDPATTFLSSGNFASSIWPYKGTENVFLAYLPLVSMVHIVNLSIFPWDMFFIRLPWLLLLIVSAFFLYKTVRAKYLIGQIAALLLVFVFICDEGISNAMRSGRVEMVILGFLSVSLYLFVRNKYPFLLTFLLGMLVLSHPAIWVAVGILMLYRWLNETIKGKLLHLLIFSVPVLFYLALARFDLDNIYMQLIVHSSEHTADAVQGNFFYKHFIGFFLPVYRVQPYMILLHVILLIYSIWRILRIRSFRANIFEILFVATDIYWLFILAPFYRYAPPLVYMMFLILPGFISFVLDKYPAIKNRLENNSFVKPVLICLLVYISFPFLFRNSVALAQRPERDAAKVFEWLDERTGEQKGRKLFIDASVAHFYSLKRENVDFTLIYAVKKFRFRDYDAVYYFTLLPEPSSAELIGTYEPPPLSPAWQKLAGVQKIVTYRGLRLYKMQNEDGMRALQKGYED